MPDVVSTTPGLYPLPDWAKDELADLKGHQKEDLIDGDEDEQLTDVYDEARRDVIGYQQAAGLDRVVEGQPRWDDMLTHPLAVHDSVDTKGIVRYYDNNNFYREPVVEGALEYYGDVAAELDAAADVVEEGLQAVLPGPYSLFDLATDEYYGDDEQFLGALGDFLAAEAAEFPDVETLFLLEPSLVVNPPGDGLDSRASEAIDAVATAIDAEVVVHTYWEAFEEKVYAHLLDADLDAVGFDLHADRDQTLYNVNEYGTTDDVALGLVDGQNTEVEAASTLADRVAWFDDQTPAADFDTVYATPNTGLFYLPVSKARAKLDALASIRKTEVPA